jgi:prepilin-type N-terminal cleavage/methylation domain-containing protein
MSAFAARRRAEHGYTLIEVLLVVGISAVIMGPLLGWAVLAIQQQPVNRDGLVRIADSGLLGAYLPEDVAVAGAAATPGAPVPADDVEVTLEDCRSGPAEAEVVLATLTGGEQVTRVVYSEAPSSADPDQQSVWRRTCEVDGTPIDAIEVVERVEPGSTSAVCSEPQGRLYCRQVEFRTRQIGAPNEIVLNGTRRADTASLRFDPTGNRIPVAKIDFISQGVGQPFTVRMSPAGSNDPDGEIVAYRWVFPTQPDGAPGGPAPVVVEGGPELADAVQSRQFPVLGTYSVTLTVTDSRGATATTYKRVIASPEAPRAVASISPEVAATGQQVTFTGSASTDADGSIVSYRWVLGEEGGATGASYVVDQADWSLAFPAYAVGRIPVTLTVTDDQGRKDTAVTSITIYPAGSDPTPEPDPDPAPPPVTVPGGPVASFTATQGGSATAWTFDASATTDDGTVASYDWDFGDSSTGSGVSPGHTYPGPGDYRVTLTATDDTGLVGTVTRTVNVPGAPAAPPAPTQSGFDLVWAPVPGTRRYLVDFEFLANGCARSITDQAVGVGPSPSRAIPPNLCAGTATARARYGVEANGQVAYSPWIDVTTPATGTDPGPGQVVK